MYESEIKIQEEKSEFQELLKLALIRTFRAIPFLLGVVTIVFILFRILPGDVAKELAGKYPTPERLALIRIKWGLDKSAVEQYIIFLQKLGEFRYKKI